jgi:glucose-1-phosphate cytidylyltransferase
MEVHQRRSEPWRVTIVDTGDATLTGGRLKRVRDHLDEDTFCFTYSDGVSDVDITKLIAFHRASGRAATVTGVQPPMRYGVLDIEDSRVVHMHEKPEDGGAWINGGFFVLQRSVIDLIADDATMWERQPLETLASRGQLSVFQHRGFWQPMDTLRDKTQLEDLWATGKAPWKTW